MATPWDPFPLPTLGDDDKTLTFQGVGMVTTQWEFMEFRLSRLYSVLVGQPDGEEAIGEYGRGPKFRARLACLKGAANKRFIDRPDQRMEAIFHRLILALTGFADRRNDVAHGIVYPVHNLEFFRKRSGRGSEGRKQYALIPPRYTLCRYNAAGEPSYAYTLKELENLAHSILMLSIEIQQYWVALNGPDAELSE